MPKNHFMKLERPSTILRILNDLKWSDRFVCLKCGNTKYIKGDGIYDRKCSKCKKNVSLYKYTAFEGLRFPIEKAYGILETLVEHTPMDVEAKVIKKYNRKHSGRQGYDLVDDPKEWQDPKNRSEEYEYLSINDIFERNRPKEKKKKLKQEKLEEIELTANRGDKNFDQIIEARNSSIKRVGSNTLDKLLEEIKNRWRPTIGMLAKKYELEENTVVKFLEKINFRMRGIYCDEPENPLQRILSQLEIDHYERGQNKRMNVIYFLGMAMVPIVGELKYGLAKINGKLCTIDTMEDSDMWSIYRVTCSDDNHRYAFHIHEPYEYGTEEWCTLHNVNIDNKC